MGKGLVEVVVVRSRASSRWDPLPKRSRIRRSRLASGESLPRHSSVVQAMDAYFHLLDGTQGTPWAGLSRPSADGLQYGCGKARLDYSALPHVLPAKQPFLESRRADSNRLPLLQLRVITQALQGCAGSCRTRISKRISVLWFAECCTVLRSRWYQSGIRTSDSYSPTAGSMARPRDLRSHNPLTPVSRRCRVLQNQLR